MTPLLEPQALPRGTPAFSRRELALSCDVSVYFSKFLTRHLVLDPLPPDETTGLETNRPLVLLFSYQRRKCSRYSAMPSASPSNCSVYLHLGVFGF